MNQEAKIDPLVELAAKWLYVLRNKQEAASGRWNEWDKQCAALRSGYRIEARSLLQTLSDWTGKDGSKIVRTDPDQTLPMWSIYDRTETHESLMSYRKQMIDSGFRKVLPLIGKEG
jgi:hypothetical protein